VTSLLSAAVLAVALPHSPLSAQTSAIVDEGTFMVTRRGAPLGRESFRIVRAPAPGGQVFLATCQSALGEQRVTTRLGTDSVGTPVSYELEVTESGRVVQRLRGRGRPGRFSVLSQTESGESAREYVLSNGALIIDDEVFHHFFFVPRTTANHVAVIAPRSRTQERTTIRDRGAGQVEIAGRGVSARHFVVEDGSGRLREVWVDARGRLLKVAVPALGLVALRDDPPR
jgi:hypothetical protein